MYKTKKAKFTKLLIFAMTAVGFLAATRASHAQSEVPQCRLKSEIEPFQLKPPAKPVQVKWGVNVPDYAHLLIDLQSGAPRRIKDLLKNLERMCVGKLASHPGCLFVSDYRQYQNLQTRLRAMLADGTFENVNEENEIVFRAINFSINPLSENASVNPDVQTSEAIKVMVEWMYRRRALATRIEDVEALFGRFPKTPSTSSQRTFLPAVKAHFASPLLVGQIAAFLRDQDCSAKTLPVCAEANRQLRVWLIEQLQNQRAHIENLMCLFEDRIHRAAAHSLPQEIQVLGELYRRDSQFRTGDAGQAELYAKWLDNQILTAVGSPQEQRGKAAMGVIIVSEILHIFQSAIPQQDALSSSVIHRDIAALERRIQSEIDEPIISLEEFIHSFEGGLQ